MMNRLQKCPFFGLQQLTKSKNNSSLFNYLKCNLHTSSPCLWRGHRNQRKFFSKPKPRKEEFQPDYTSYNMKTKQIPFGKSCLPDDFKDYRFKYPDFLPRLDPLYRHSLAEKLEREEMFRRRKKLFIPEFYVGSYLAVTVSDFWSNEKVSKFVGICIAREGQGLYSTFTLRNAIENEGVEIRYDLYNPTIRSIEVLKLEKRLDDHLYYLRDAPLEHSYVPFDFKPEIKFSNNSDVPVNKVKIKLNPYPWSKYWHKHVLRGVELLENIPKWRYDKHFKELYVNQKYDLMKDYRENVPEEDQLYIWKELKENLKDVHKRELEARRQKLLAKSDKD